MNAILGHEHPQEEIPLGGWCFVCGQESKDDSLPCSECSEGMSLADWAEYTHGLTVERNQTEARIGHAKAQIQRLMEKPQTAYAGSFQVSWRRYKRDQMDFKRLRSEQFDIWESYTTPSEVNAVYIDVINN